MLVKVKKVTTKHTRQSKFNKTHTYTRTKTVAVIQCDNCQTVFEREQGKMDPKRISPEYYHVCSNCNPKQFAQKRGVERRKLWNISADSDIDITKL